MLEAMRVHYAKIEAGEAGVWLQAPGGGGFYRVHGEIAAVLFLERFVAADRRAIAGVVGARWFDQLAAQGLAFPPEEEVHDAAG